MDLDVIAITISLGTSVVSGTVLFFVKRYFTKRDARDEQAERTRRQTSLLTLRSINAIGKLTEANAIAIRDGTTTGELKAALEEYSKVNAELYDFLFEHVASHN